MQMDNTQTEESVQSPRKVSQASPISYGQGGSRKESPWRGQSMAREQQAGHSSRHYMMSPDEPMTASQPPSLSCK